MSQQRDAADEKVLGKAKEPQGQGGGNGQGRGEQHPQEIPFHVDGELEKTTQAVWTPNDIIREFGEKDPATHYLTQIQGPEKGTSYKDVGDVPITIRPGYHFQIVSIGATPVSDGRTLVGVEAFMQGLREMGYEPQLLEGHSNHVFFDYEVGVGRFAAAKVRLGFVVPQDFGNDGWPTGPHVSPHIRPINQQHGPHPTHGVHPSDKFAQHAGGDWQYWSRPFQEGKGRNKTVVAYMSHIHRLWETQ